MAAADWSIFFGEYSPRGIRRQCRGKSGGVTTPEVGLQCQRQPQPPLLPPSGLTAGQSRAGYLNGELSRLGPPTQSLSAPLNLSLLQTYFFADAMTSLGIRWFFPVVGETLADADTCARDCILAANNERWQHCQGSPEEYVPLIEPTVSAVPSPELDHGLTLISR